MALRGACSLGFRITLQPAPSAGAILEMICIMGASHGVMSAQTPTGSQKITDPDRRSSKGKRSP
jgi:hypothetical protein